MKFWIKHKKSNDHKTLVRTYFAKELSDAHFVANALIKDGRNHVTIWQRKGLEAPFTYSVTWDEPRHR